MITETTPVKEALSQHEKQLLAIYEKNVQTGLLNISQLKESGLFVPPILIHQLRDQQKEINKIYKKKGEQPKYDVSEVNLSDEQRQLDEQRQNLLKIHTLNLQHAQQESQRLKDMGKSDEAAQIVIEESQKAINGIMGL